MAQLLTREVTFEQARTNPELRQNYLDQIFPLCPESVESLVYDPEWKHINECINKLPFPYNLGSSPRWDSELFTVGPPVTYGLETKHPIFVGREVLDLVISEPHFMSFLYDHEVFHAEDMAHGIKLDSGFVINYRNVHLFRDITLLCVIEIRAIKNQLRKVSERDIKDECFESHLINQLKRYQNHLTYLIDPRTISEDLVRKEVLNFK
jgi:hypothetical protein